MFRRSLTDGAAQDHSRPGTHRPRQQGNGHTPARRARRSMRLSLASNGMAVTPLYSANGVQAADGSRRPAAHAV
jgi:hypothetical protein